MSDNGTGSKRQCQGGGQEQVDVTCGRDNCDGGSGDGTGRTDHASSSSSGSMEVVEVSAIVTKSDGLSSISAGTDRSINDGDDTFRGEKDGTTVSSDNEQSSSSSPMPVDATRAASTAAGTLAQVDLNEADSSMMRILGDVSRLAIAHCCDDDAEKTQVAQEVISVSSLSAIDLYGLSECDDNNVPIVCHSSPDALHSAIFGDGGSQEADVDARADDANGLPPTLFDDELRSDIYTMKPTDVVTPVQVSGRDAIHVGYCLESYEGFATIARMDWTSIAREEGEKPKQSLGDDQPVPAVPFSGFCPRLVGERILSEIEWLGDEVIDVPVQVLQRMFGKTFLFLTSYIYGHINDGSYRAAKRSCIKSLKIW